MATTTNYAWTTPDNSGLVKNGAQDIRTLGSAVDTSLWNVGFGQAGKNKIINGDFGIWQRGTSFNTAANLYTADRWLTDISGTPTTATVTRQSFTPGTAPVAGYQGSFFLRSTITTVGTLTNLDLLTRIEDVRTFSGQTVTLSFWAKSDSTRTSLVYLYQNTGVGGSGSAFGTPSTPALTTTTSWQRYSFTIALGSLSGATIGTSSYLQVAIRQAVAAGSVLDIWGVQLEVGSIATPFQTATGTLAGELAACQRYYYRITQPSGSYHRYSVGQCSSTTSATAVIPFPVTMRTAPTALEQVGTAGNYAVTNASNGVQICTAVPTFSLASEYLGLVTFTAASLVAGNATTVMGTISTTNYLGWSAEL